MTSTELTSEQREMVAANLGLVGFAVPKWARTSAAYDFDDAFNDGFFGLVRAAQLFRPELGHRFSTYAVIWIRQAMQRGFDSVEGSNYRRVERSGDDWVAPLSLDYEYDSPSADDGPVSLAGLIADGDPEPDELTARRLDAERAVRLVRESCRTEIERDLVEEMMAADVPQAEVIVRLAARHGVGLEAVRWHWRNLRARTLEAVAA